MRSRTAQNDLFATAEERPAAPETFLSGIRAELNSLLQRARGAERLPWADYTQSALAELRFDGLARWLPEPEAAALRAAFARELDRLYAKEPVPPAA